MPEKKEVKMLLQYGSQVCLQIPTQRGTEDTNKATYPQ